MSGSAVVLDASILVVDDSEADARLIETMLRGNGFTSITTTTDSRAACGLHRAHDYDLVLLDVVMPGMDGFEVLAALHAVDSDLPVPVIMTTAEPDHMKRALEAGARDFIGKPIRMIELLSRVRNALELGRLLKDARAHGRELEETLEERTIDLREAEQRYRALVERSITGIYIVEDGYFTYANPRLCEWLGYPLEELRLVSTMELVHPDDRKRLAANRAKREAGDHSALTDTYRFKRRDGRDLHLSVSGESLGLKGRRVIQGVAQDVTEQVRAEALRRRAQAELETANRRLRTLSERVLAIQEEERRHISRELHDDVGQSLLALNIGLHRLTPPVTDAQRRLLAECIAVTAAVQEKLREISVQLHPPHLDQLGLQDALRWLVNRQREMTGIAIECRFHEVEGLRVAPALEAACYRICQEALTNATRHASARSVSVELAVRHGLLVLRVSDDGVGFDQAAQRAGLVTSGSMGLIGMEERARLAGGRLKLRSAPSAGTCVSALFPMEAAPVESAHRSERV